VLYPHASATQAMLAYALADVPPAHSGWAAFVASSPAYRLPDDLAERLAAPASRRERHQGVELCLDKTRDGLLASVSIPASFDDGAPRRPLPANAEGVLRPGRPGYQQHLWHASLARGCHVFVNHPGATFDGTQSRPGYWYGNGVLPRLAQRGGMLLEIFRIPASHPVHFTHAHWPADAFDRQELRDHWAFGQRRSGRIALWCSRPLRRHDDVLTARELRAEGRHVAWVCLCGSAADGDFDAFIRACTARRPQLDDAGLVLRVDGDEALRWDG
jgi:hypothetical protein